jgi:hypothetical protein
MAIFSEEHKVTAGAPALVAEWSNKAPLSHRRPAIA